MNEFLDNNLDNKIDLIRRKTYPFIYIYMEKTWDNLATNANVINVFIKNVKDNIRKIVPEAVGVDAEVDKVLNFLGEKDTNSLRETFLDKATEITIKILAKHLSLQELEHRFNKNPLSRGLSFKIDKNNKKVNLYIPPTFFENLHQATQSYIDGLRLLAHKMLIDKEFKDIQEVVGFSPFVKEHYKVLEKYGFEITLDKDGQPTEEAKMSKEKLLEIYGK